MTRFTREARQEIVEAFARANGGVFDAGAFLAEVSQVGKKHAAWDWFEWNDNKAAREHRLDQARDFARGLVVRFEIQVVDRGATKVVSQSVPLIMSPTDNRRQGGGYVMTDPDDPQHMAELCRQAAQGLRWFIERFEAAIRHAGGDVAPLVGLRKQLIIASSVRQPEAAEKARQARRGQAGPG